MRNELSRGPLTEIEVPNPPRWIMRTAWCAWAIPIVIVVLALLAACAPLAVKEKPACRSVTFEVLHVEGQNYYVLSQGEFAALIARMKSIEAGECRSAEEVKPARSIEYRKNVTRT
jgi:hypothetical protein